MKQIVKTSRLTGQLEHLFNILNSELFNDELPAVIISVNPTPKVYGHYTTFDAWQFADGTSRREINIGSGTLSLDLCEIAGVMVHEMCHCYADTCLHVQDCGQNGQYHNRIFRDIAVSHGLLCSHDARYGWTITSPADELIDLVAEHDELRDIEMFRPDIGGCGCHGGHGSTGAAAPAKQSSRKLVCPCCNTIIRATKTVRVICADCMELFVEV